MKQIQIDSFRIFKTISCLGVVLVHYGQVASLDGIPRTITDFGLYGVYMFFIISGFLSYLSYSHSRSCKQYYLKRIFRILPLYYTIIIYNIILYEFILKGQFELPADSSHLGWLRYFLLLNQILPSSDNFWINLSATWTISHFMLFYLFTPIFFKYINTFYKSIVLLSCCFIFNFTWHMNILLPLTSFYFFAMGIAIYLGFKEHKENLLIAFSSLSIILLLLFQFDLTYIYSNLFLLLIIASRNFHVKSKVFTKIILLLDEYSFTIYLVHAVIIEAIARYISVQPLSPCQIFIILAIGTILISVLLHHIIEKPSLRFINSKIKTM